jgi:hypothetical protein
MTESDRTVYGDAKNATPRKWKWLQELKQQKRKRYQDRDLFYEN